MTDEDFFGIEIPETKELYFICIMGNARHTFGFCVYRGFEGFRFYQRLLQGIDDFNDPEFRLRQNSLLLEFTEKQFMQAEDLALFEKHNYKPKSSKAWPYFRSIKPSSPPWFIDEIEAKGLITAIEVIPDMAEKMKIDPGFAFGDSGKTYPVYIKKPSGWKIEWMGSRKIGNREGFDPDAEFIKINELAVKRILLNKIKKVESTWEVAQFFLLAPVVKDDQPFYPKMIAIIERGTGFAVGVDMIDPNSNPMSALKEMILQKILDYNYIPGTIAMDDFWLAMNINIVAEKLDILMHRGELENMPEFQAHVLKKSKES